MLSCFPQKLGPSTKTKHTRSLQHQRLGCVGIQSVSDVSGFNLLGTCYYNALYIYCDKTQQIDELNQLETCQRKFSAKSMMDLGKHKS